MKRVLNTEYEYQLYSSMLFHYGNIAKEGCHGIHALRRTM